MLCLVLHAGRSEAAYALNWACRSLRSYRHWHCLAYRHKVDILGCAGTSLRDTKWTRAAKIAALNLMSEPYFVDRKRLM
jgi:hypothetical protein